MKAGDVEPDRFYYDQALRLVEKRARGGPAVHFRLHGGQPFSLVEQLSAGIDAELARTGQ